MKHITLLLFIAFSLISCELQDTYLNVSAESFTFEQEGGSQNLVYSTNARTHSVFSDADWIEFASMARVGDTLMVQVKALANPGTEVRNATITVLAGNEEPVLIPVTQLGGMYPSYNTSPIPPDASGMSSTAVQLAAKIDLGWNMGNSLEAIGGETAWGNPKISKALIDLVKASGFNAVRLPCSWHQHMQTPATALLKPLWLDRVKEVIQYCVDNDMYVLLNIHWDGGWLENNVTVDKQAANNAKLKAFWEQIATHLRDFDEHLLFAGGNEPNAHDAVQMAVLDSYHQTFVDAVRSTGGRNAYRTLVVQGPSTDIETTNKFMKKMPADAVADRLMVEVHYYTPWNFCGLTEDASWGKMFYYWGKDYRSTTDTERNASWGEEATVKTNFALMKTQFVDKGIPVVLGEYSATRRVNLTGDALDLHLASRAYYSGYVTRQAKAYGLLPFYWDNGGLADGCGIFDRHALSVFDQAVLEELKKQ